MVANLQQYVTVIGSVVGLIYVIWNIIIKVINSRRQTKLIAAEKAYLQQKRVRAEERFQLARNEIIAELVVPDYELNPTLDDLILRANQNSIADPLRKVEESSESHLDFIALNVLENRRNENRLLA